MNGEGCGPTPTRLPAAEVQERARTPKALKKRGLKAAIPGEVKASRATGRRKPKSDLSQKSLRVKTPTEGAALCCPATSILTQVLGRGCFQKAGLTEPAGWGCPGAALLGEGSSLEGTCVPGGGRRGMPEV